VSTITYRLTTIGGHFVHARAVNLERRCTNVSVSICSVADPRGFIVGKDIKTVSICSVADPGGFVVGKDIKTVSICSVADPRGFVVGKDIKTPKASRGRTPLRDKC